jgi:hypothetical protein
MGGKNVNDFSPSAEVRVIFPVESLRDHPVGVGKS